MRWRALSCSALTPNTKYTLRPKTPNGSASLPVDGSRTVTCKRTQTSFRHAPLRTCLMWLSRPSGKSVETSYFRLQSRPGNNLDFLRFAAAMLVIVGHQYALFGFAPPALAGAGVHTWGLRIFFVISGWLISQSWERDPHVIRFAVRRGLRLLPALIVLTLATTFVLGPLCTSSSLEGYFTNGRTYQYFENDALYIIYYLPGVFETTPVKFAVNGSLWSLPSEVSMYMMVAVLGLALNDRCKSPILWMSLFVVAAALNYYLAHYYSGPELIFYATSVAATVDVGTYFIAGALLWRCCSRHRPRLAAGCVALSALYLFEGIRPALGPILFAYGVMSFGLTSTPILKTVARYGDLSYGAYLYAFPIQQLSYQLFGSHRFLLSLFFSISMTLCCAYGSWHFVERWALRIKPSRPSVLRAAVT